MLKNSSANQTVPSRINQPTVLVPDRRCRILLKVVLVRRWVTGDSGNLEGGGFGERVGKGEVSLQAT